MIGFPFPFLPAGVSFCIVDVRHASLFRYSVFVLFSLTHYWPTEGFSVALSALIFIT
jgi:hypothetical protein